MNQCGSLLDNFGYHSNLARWTLGVVICPLVGALGTHVLLSDIALREKISHIVPNILLNRLWYTTFQVLKAPVYLEPYCANTPKIVCD